MSDDKPTITVTRGTRGRRSKRSTESSSAARSGSSSGWLPGAGTLVSGTLRGVRKAWWAGLGLLDAAQSAGTQVFDALVEEGKSWEQARRERTTKTARRVREMAEEHDAIQATEERVREEVNAALRRVGAPSRDEVDALRQQVDALGERIETLQAAIAEREGEDEGGGT